jgi:hypothetical protein
MTFKLYDYVSEDGTNEFKSWTRSLQKVELAKLNQRLDKLLLHGTSLRPEMLAGTGIGGLEKLRIKGTTQLRPLLCTGPIRPEDEFTLLFGAREKGDKWVPKDALQQAVDRKLKVKQNPTGRRKDHERVS